MQSLVAFYRLGAKLCLRNLRDIWFHNSLFCEFSVSKVKLALRVTPAVTWLTVYSWLQMVRSTLLPLGAPLGAQMKQWQLHPKLPLKWPLCRTPAPWWCPGTINLDWGKLEEIPRKVFIPILVSGTDFLIDNGLGRGFRIMKNHVSQNQF